MRGFEQNKERPGLGREGESVGQREARPRWRGRVCRAKDVKCKTSLDMKMREIKEEIYGLMEYGGKIQLIL